MSLVLETMSEMIFLNWFCQCYWSLPFKVTFSILLAGLTFPRECLTKGVDVIDGTLTSSLMGAI